MLEPDLARLQVENGAALNGLLAETSFSLDVIPSSVMTTVIVRVPAGALVDLAGNANRDKASISVQHDLIPPTVRLSSTAGRGPSATERYPITPTSASGYRASTTAWSPRARGSSRTW